MLSFDAGREVGMFYGLTGTNWDSLRWIKWVVYVYKINGIFITNCMLERE